MYREPFFEIIDVVEPRGRSMGDIAADVLKGRRVGINEVRSDRRDRFIVNIRKEIISRFMRERRDLSSGQMAIFLNMDASTIRHHWRKLAAAS